MPNILINPRSGILEFNTGIAGGAVFDTNLSGLRMTYDNFGGVNLLSYNTNVSSGLDRFTIDGANGRLFSVTDNLSGSLFSVNDIAGLPIIEAFDDNTVVMGAFNKNDFIISGGCVGIGALPDTGFTKLLVNGTGVFGTSNTNYTRLTSNPLSVIGSGNTFVQLNIQNLAIGDSASSDLVLTSNAGTDDSFYLDLGINNSGYNQAAYNIGNSGDGYLYIHGGNLTIGTQSPNRTIKFHTDGTTSANQIAEINSTGYFSPNKAVIALSGFFGRNNRFVGADVTMGGGENNIISGNDSIIVGGLNNSITGCFSNIAGGCFNLIHGNVNTIGGGTRNAIGACCNSANLYFTTTLNNFIGGGSGHCVSPNSCYNFIGGGTNNTINSPIAQYVCMNHNIILGGQSNCMVGSAGCNSILGGFCNTLSSCTSTIVGGCCNNMSHPNSIIAYGACNTGSAAQSSPGIFIGGINNRIDTSSSSAILGGCDNKIYGNCSSIIGGHSNKIGFLGDTARLGYSSFIGGGGFNIITGTQPSCSTITEYSLIVGGYANKITSCFASILGGRQNLVTHVGATVIGDGGARDKVSRGVCSLSLDFNGGIFLTGSNITLSPSPLPGRVDFCDSNLINATPNILNVNSNFSIGTGYNSRVVLANSGSILTGTISLGNPTGFNSSIIQIGVGQVQITGAAGVIIQTYNNQFKTAGQYATVSLLHSGNDGYIMYGNTA